MPKPVLRLGAVAAVCAGVAGTDAVLQGSPPASVRRSIHQAPDRSTHWRRERLASGGPRWHANFLAAQAPSPCSLALAENGRSGWSRVDADAAAAGQLTVRLHARWIGLALHRASGQAWFKRGVGAARSPSPAPRPSPTDTITVALISHPARAGRSAPHQLEVAPPSGSAAAAGVASTSAASGLAQHPQQQVMDSGAAPASSPALEVARRAAARGLPGVYAAV